MADKPEKMSPPEGQKTPQEPEKKEAVPPVPEKGVPIDEGTKKPTESQYGTKEQGKQAETDEKEVTEEKSEPLRNLEQQRAAAKRMSNSELMEAIFSKLGGLIETLSKGGFDKLFGGGGLNFSPKQMEEVKVDIAAAEKKEYDPKSENKAVEFVCHALDLPVKNSVMTLLYSLQNSPGVVYEKDKNKLNEGKVGDLLFFRKEGEEQPHLTSIISDIGPPMMMKYMDEKGEIKQEEVLKSPFYEQEWFGLVKLPEKQKTNETPKP